jgi:AcrR family transcriptional regulator
MKSSVDVPAPRTRPRNRRAITLDAATKLFYRDGYASVAMSDIAAATNVGPSAIYRHFPGKADILMAAIQAGIAPYVEFLTAAREPRDGSVTEFSTVCTRLAECALDHRELGVLWQRDARNLDDEQQRPLREELRVATRLLASFIADERPELDATQADVLAWCALGAVVSIGFHALTLPRAEFVQLLAELVMDIALVPMAAVHADAPSPRREVAASETRREQLITVATELFAERGFSAVGVDDIAEAAGIAGPSVYAHFPSKLAILTSAIDRAAALVRRDADHVLESHESPQVKLARLVASYTRLANRDRFIIRTLISEMDRLPQHDRDIARRVQRDYIDTWVELRRQFTDEGSVEARIRVQAVLLVVNDAVQTPHLRSLPGFEATLRRIAGALLGV